jgi:HSP20 family protein
MTLVRFDPFRDLMGLQERVNRLFSENLFRTGGDAAQVGAWSPAVDIYEDGDTLVFEADLPGVRKDDIDIRVENSTLTLEGERRQEHEVKDEQFHRVERSYGKFLRSFTLPAGIDADKIRAEVRDGLLRVTLPKAEDAKPKRVKILAA